MSRGITRRSRRLAEQLRACSSESPDTEAQYAFLNHANNDELLESFRTISRSLIVLRRTH